MSTEYIITDRLMIAEQSSKATFIVYEEPSGYRMKLESLDESQLRTAIIRMIRVLAYISEDPDQVLEEFNVTYEDKKMNYNPEEVEKLDDIIQKCRVQLSELDRDLNAQIRKLLSAGTGIVDSHTIDTWAVPNTIVYAILKDKLGNMTLSKEQQKEAANLYRFL